MIVRQVDGRWLAQKNKKAKRWEDITDIVSFDGDDFMSVMGKAGRTDFHAYLGKSGGRWLSLHGVTSIVGAFGKPEKLIDWAVNKAVDYLQENEGDFIGARKAHKRSLGESATAGKDVHAEVEDFINTCLKHGGKLSATKEASEQAQEFQKWALEENITFLASEKVVHSRNWWCAGTLDFLCEWNGKRYIGDVKTSNYVSTKHFLQMGAYAGMLGDVDGVVIVHLPKSGGINIITNDKVGVTVDKLTNGFRDLLGLVKIDDVISSNLY